MRPSDAGEQFITLTPRFRMGLLRATPAAREALSRAGEVAGTFLARHVSPPAELWSEAGDTALEQAFRVLSIHRTRAGETLWIITEADRSQTTILLPDEYGQR